MPPGGAAAAARRPGGDDLPGAGALLRPDLLDRALPGRDPAHASPRARPGGAARPLGGAAAGGRHRRGGAPPGQFPAPILRRHVAAGDDRPRPGRGPGRADRRRADHRAGRHGAGAGGGAAAAPARRARAGDPVHQSRSGPRRRDRGPHRGDVRRPGDGTGPHGRHTACAAPPLHARPARCPHCRSACTTPSSRCTPFPAPCPTRCIPSPAVRSRRAAP